MDKGVIVTGGNGYIGLHLCKKLSDAGYVPIIIDNSIIKNPNPQKYIAIRSDIKDIKHFDLYELKQKYDVDTIHHLAGFKDAAESTKKPLKYYENNVGAATEFIHTAAVCGINRIINSSSAAVYGDSTIDMAEFNRTIPLSPYGHSKLMFEQVLRDTAAAYQMKCVTLRYFNVGGTFGDVPFVNTGSVIEKLLGPAGPFRIYGDNYGTKDGTPARDYVHVEDVVDAHMAAHNFISKAPGIYNVGTGITHTVKEVIQMVCRITGVDFGAVFDDRRPGDIGYSGADISKLRGMGWKPQHGLESICKSHIKWVESLELAQHVVG